VLFFSLWIEAWQAPYGGKLTTPHISGRFVPQTHIMLMIRLQRIGRKNDPSFRIIVTDKRESTKSNRFADIVGTYAPKSGGIEIDATKVKHWLSKGAQASPTVHNMLVTKKIIEGKKINVLPKVKILAALKAEQDKKDAERRAEEEKQTAAERAEAEKKTAEEAATTASSEPAVETPA
jgi:small subunit ribosomal protein S16